MDIILKIPSFFAIKIKFQAEKSKSIFIFFVIIRSGHENKHLNPKENLSHPQSSKYKRRPPEIAAVSIAGGGARRRPPPLRNCRKTTSLLLLEEKNHAGGGRGEGGEDSRPAPAGWAAKTKEKWRTTKEHAETYPYVWASYIVVYGWPGVYATYKWRKLLRMEDRVEAEGETAARGGAAASGSSSASAAEKTVDGSGEK